MEVKDIPLRTAAVGMAATSLLGSVLATSPSGKPEVSRSQLLTSNVGLSSTGERLRDTWPSEMWLASAVRWLLLTLLKQLAGHFASCGQEDGDGHVGGRELAP